MKTLLYVTAALMIVSSAWAQQSPARQDVDNTVQILERQVETQQDRVRTVEQKLKATDEQIERRLDRLVGYLTTVTDGADSRRKVLTAKQDIFDGLLRYAEFYARERGQRYGALGQPSSQAMKEALAADIVWLNNRVEKRIDQALALVASLPAEQDLPKDFYYYDYDNWQVRRNPAYTHQQRVMSVGGQWREQALAKLKTSIDRLKRARAELDRALTVAKTDEGRKFIQSLIQRDEQLLAKRREQIQVALNASNPAAKPLGNNAANALTEQIQEAKKNNKQDNAEWIRLKNERETERARLLALQERLDYYRQQLK